MVTTVRVLIVESDVTKAEEMWNEVRLAGHQPSIAFSIDVANTLVVDNQPHVVLLRWNLPDASGLSFLNDLRTRSATRRLPVIVLGEDGAAEDECIRALEAGADDYTRWPYGRKEVLARVQSVLRLLPRMDRRHIISIKEVAFGF